MDNYALSLESARLHFLEYVPAVLEKRLGVQTQGPYLTTRFLGADTRIEQATGQVAFSYDGFVSSWEAGFGEALSVYDWLCDRKPDAVAAEDFCPVASLPGVYVGGSGLAMTGGNLPQIIDKDPGAFRRAIEAMGGLLLPLGDIGCRLQVFPDLPMCLKFYHGDEDFPPSMTFLWDKNTLRFVRYETVYYIAGTLLERLKGKLLPGASH